MDFISAIFCTILAGIFLIMLFRKGEKTDKTEKRMESEKNSTMTQVPDKKGIINFMTSNKSDFKKESLQEHVYQSHLHEIVPISDFIDDLSRHDEECKSVDVKHKGSKIIHIPDGKKFQKFILSSKSDSEKAFHLKHTWKSYQLNRSTNSATILLLGTSGAGKSSTINSIFGTKITEVGEDQSCTSQLIEISGKFPSEFLGISNSQIHVIDTPGFNDNQGGLEFDAHVMANIPDFFKGKGYLPNIVLLALNYTDNRLDGKFSHFVKILQAIRQQLKGSVVDIDHPNLIVVLTHLCSAKPTESKNPNPKIQLVKRLIAQHIGIKDCPVVVAENCPEEWNLEKIKPDYYKLPNSELFPRNILQAIKTLTENVDPVGCYLIQDAYRNLSKLKTKFEKKMHEIVYKPETAGIVAKIMKMHASTDTELGTVLEKGEYSFNFVSDK